MKKAFILGAGESGVGAALLAKAKGYDVFVSDNSTIKSEYKKILLENVPLGSNTQDFLHSTCQKQRK